jgi:replicative DNA helicase
MTGADLAAALIERRRIREAGLELVVPTGFSELDRALHRGLYGGTYTVLAGKTSTGKSILASQVASHAAEQFLAAGHGHRVVALSCEMSGPRLAERLALLLGDGAITLEQLRSPARLDAAAEAALSAAAARISQIPLTIHDRMPRSVAEMRALLESEIRSGAKLLIVDYIQAYAKIPGIIGDTEASRIAAISRLLQQIATEHDVAVLALAQLNRTADEGTGDTALSQLQGSSALEQDPDTVIYLRRRLHSAAGVLEVMKARDGLATGTSKIQLAFDAPRARFDCTPGVGTPSRKPARTGAARMFPASIDPLDDIVAPARGRFDQESA